jgi:uncharacterized caspase-like protein
LTVDGSPVKRFGAAGDLQRESIGRRLFEDDVLLPTGGSRVSIRVVAYDSLGLRSRPAEVVVQRPANPGPPGVLRVLAAGINHYADPAIPDLAYAVPDAAAFARSMSQQSAGRLYRTVTTNILTDAAADRTGLRFAFRDLADAAEARDTVVVFLSGHGVQYRPGEYYFACEDTLLSELPETALSWDEFCLLLRSVRATRVIVFVDSCHSGSVLGQQSDANASLALMANSVAQRMVFVASQRSQPSLGLPKFGHGAFTQALLEAVRGAADADRDGSITYHELRDYTIQRVVDLTGGRQEPELPFLDAAFPSTAAFAHALYGR